MQQRQPRLGDVVDDYCPRERRVTNHAVVAMVGDEVKQTRCTTCDAEHDYKHAKVPPQRKKKDVPGALYQQVLDGIPRVVPPDQAPDDEPEAEAAIVQAESEADVEGDAAPLAADAAPAGEHEGPVHRRLIRATLPRLPGAEPPVRREPEFTMRTPAHGRSGKPKNGFRGGGMQRAGGPGSRAGAGQRPRQPGQAARPPGGRWCLEPLGSARLRRPRSRGTAPGARRQEAFAIARFRARSPRHSYATDVKGWRGHYVPRVSGRAAAAGQRATAGGTVGSDGSVRAHRRSADVCRAPAGSAHHAGHHGGIAHLLQAR